MRVVDVIGEATIAEAWFLLLKPQPSSLWSLWPSSVGDGAATVALLIGASTRAGISVSAGSGQCLLCSTDQSIGDTLYDDDSALSISGRSDVHSTWNCARCSSSSGCPVDR